MAFGGGEDKALPSVRNRHEGGRTR